MRAAISTRSQSPAFEALYWPASVRRRHGRGEVVRDGRRPDRRRAHGTDSSAARSRGAPRACGRSGGALAKRRGDGCRARTRAAPGVAVDRRRCRDRRRGTSRCSRGRASVRRPRARRAPGRRRVERARSGASTAHRDVSPRCRTTARRGAGAGRPVGRRLVGRVAARAAGGLPRRAGSARSRRVPRSRARRPARTNSCGAAAARRGGAAIVRSARSLRCRVPYELRRWHAPPAFDAPRRARSSIACARPIRGARRGRARSAVQPELVSPWIDAEAAG